MNEERIRGKNKLVPCGGLFCISSYFFHRHLVITMADHVFCKRHLVKSFYFVGKSKWRSYCRYHYGTVFVFFGFHILGRILLSCFKISMGNLLVQLKAPEKWRPYCRMPFPLKKSGNNKGFRRYCELCL